MIGQDNLLPLLGWKILLILANLGWTILGENGHDSQFFWQVINQVPIFKCTKQQQKYNARLYLMQFKFNFADEMQIIMPQKGWYVAERSKPGDNIRNSKGHHCT